MSFRIAFAKGRGALECIRLLEHDELQLPRAFYDGKLPVHHVPRLDLLCLLQRGRDVVNMLRQGHVDAVIASELLFAEYGSESLSQAAEFEIGKCRFSLITLNDTSQVGVTRIATRYPNLTRKLLRSIQDELSIIELGGSVETALFLGLSDGITDIVETGQTLRMLALQERTVLATFCHGIWFRSEDRQECEEKLEIIMPAIRKGLVDGKLI